MSNYDTFTPLECPAYPVRINSNGVKKHGDGIQKDYPFFTGGIKPHVKF